MSSSTFRDDAVYRALFDVNTAIKLLIDPASGLVLDANEPAVEFYGWPLETLRTMTIDQINTLSGDEVAREMQLAKSGRRRYFRFRHRTATGEIRHVEVHSGPVVLGDRHLLFSIIHDVTDRDALERQLKASQGLEAIGRLAGGISHEFNNLLTVILNNSSMLMRSVPADSPHWAQLTDLHSASKRAADLTRELLAFSRRQVMNPVALELNDLVQQMISVLQRTLGAAVEVETELEQNLPTTHIDPRQFEYILMNLVFNARDATTDGGKIGVQTKSVDVGEGHISGVPPGRWLTLRVDDSGEGMDEETRDRIFEPFFTTKSQSGGSGLGLATVYGIVQQIGGHIRVDSEPGQGTTITIFLPVVDAPPRSVPRSSRLAPDMRGKTVVLVEDRDPVRKCLAHGLREQGLVVYDVATAEEAERLFEGAERVDALVTDILLGQSCGVDLAHKLAGPRPLLAVLMISGDIGRTDVSHIPNGGRALQKPVTAAQIVEELARLVASRQRVRERMDAQRR